MRNKRVIRDVRVPASHASDCPSHRHPRNAPAWHAPIRRVRRPLRHRHVQHLPQRRLPAPPPPPFPQISAPRGSIIPTLLQRSASSGRMCDEIKIVFPIFFKLFQQLPYLNPRPADPARNAGSSSSKTTRIMQQHPLPATAAAASPSTANPPSHPACNPGPSRIEHIIHNLFPLRPVDIVHYRRPQTAGTSPPGGSGLSRLVSYGICPPCCPFPYFSPSVAAASPFALRALAPRLPRESGLSGKSC